jgi:fructokinase
VPAARRAGIAVSFGGDRRVVRAAIEELVEAATIVKASAEDIAWLYPHYDPVKRMRQWAAGSGRRAVLTTGADGCIGIVGSHVISGAATPVSVADTVGAGDSFTAALLANLAATDTLRVAPTLPADRIRDALEFAIRAATITCGRTGSYSPSIEELR